MKIKSSDREHLKHEQGALNSPEDKKGPGDGYNCKGLRGTKECRGWRADSQGPGPLRLRLRPDSEPALVGVQADVDSVSPQLESRGLLYPGKEWLLDTVSQWHPDLRQEERGHKYYQKPPGIIHVSSSQTKQLLQLGPAHDEAAL